MEWLTSIKDTINYLEEYLLTFKGAEEVAKEVNISSFYLQKGFKVLTGYTISEYVKNRRLYLASLEILSKDTKVIDLAYKYGYETPESFTKAFSRFHEATPSSIKKGVKRPHVFLPLKIMISIKGGNTMDYVVEEMKGFKVIGFEKFFDYETAYQEIPKFWGETYGQKIAPLCKKTNCTKEEEILKESCIGMYGVNIEDGKNGQFRYLLAGNYMGGEVPEGLKVYEFENSLWAKFTSKGPMPGALQAVNDKIYKEWLPNNSKYEIAFNASLEVYPASMDTQSPDYECAIWIPVKEK